ncbi:YtzH-like family protein [Peribacillus sp. NPDC046944]|uniref:YtzH-like family protein n=1 Tax=unclassified Peribacillus TaxID=2675266 RepID=UPI00388F7903
MPLSHENQLHLLKDILYNQNTDCCGSVAEYEQVERLVKSLMVNADIDQNVKTILKEIYEYSQTGIGASDLEAHINSHQDDLSQWIDDIDQFN